MREYWKKICMKMIALISHNNYYSQFYLPSCEMLRVSQQTVDSCHQVILCVMGWPTHISWPCGALIWPVSKCHMWYANWSSRCWCKIMVWRVIPLGTELLVLVCGQHTPWSHFTQFLPIGNKKQTIYWYNAQAMEELNKNIKLKTVKVNCAITNGNKSGKYNCFREWAMEMYSHYYSLTIKWTK
jgi:hypothetical protein